jgi:phospholipase C
VNGGEPSRRDFLRLAGLAAGTATLTKFIRPVRMLGRSTTESATSILDGSASSCPIDTVVVAMMENRSFDHLVGWLATDEEYLERGRSRYGRGFAVDGAVDQSYRDPTGIAVATIPAETYEREKVETRGCTFRIPGHDWRPARVQRDEGFLAEGTGNDRFALTYYRKVNLPFYGALLARFTVFDRWHSSLLGPTFPNRQYLFSAQSEGRKHNIPGNPADVYTAETIWDRLAGAGVPAGYYNTDYPLLAMWGQDRMAPFIRPLDRYFEDAAAGTLPNVVFVEPGFTGPYRTDDHPRGDIGMAQRWVRDVFSALARSPQWTRSAFVLTYDEGGGFFDHVRPPVLPDARASARDQDNFGQAGFRVPALVASPYARPGAVDHRPYDHTSILRFLEWRFLGAPPEGSGTAGSRPRWAFTTRDARANNMGHSLRASNPEPDLGFDPETVHLPAVSPPCTATQLAAHPPDLDADTFESPELDDLATGRFPGATYTPWLDGVKHAFSPAG